MSTRPAAVRSWVADYGDLDESHSWHDMARVWQTPGDGEAVIDEHYRAFETICSATQDRQDAVQALLAERRFDAAVVVGGYNSSNTRNLARICADAVPSYHISDVSCLLSADEIRHRPTTAALTAGDDGLVTTRSWLPSDGPITAAVTAGASTPDSIVGAVIQRLGALVGA